MTLEAKAREEWRDGKRVVSEAERRALKEAMDEVWNETMKLFTRQRFAYDVRRWMFDHVNTVMKQYIAQHKWYVHREAQLWRRYHVNCTLVK
jgi:hypothetical protein